MAFRPLVLDPATGIPKVLPDGASLSVGGQNGTVGGLHHTGGYLGFFGHQGLKNIPELHGQDFDVLRQLIDSLVELGLFEDHRRFDWDDRFASFAQLGDVSPFCTGRLIVGSLGGWTALDLPANDDNTLQVPARAHDVLGYVPAVTVGPSAPTRPVTGCLWIEPSGSAQGSRIRVFKQGHWFDVLSGALGDLQRMGVPTPGQLFIGGIGQWQTLMPGAFGEALTIDAQGHPAWSPPSFFGNQPPAGPHRLGAIWADSSRNAEALAFWDGRTWRGVPVGSRPLNTLAELAPVLQSGDLVFWNAGRMQRLANGADGTRLTMRSGTPRWEQDLVVSDTPPSGINGQLWYDRYRGVLKVHDGHQWCIADGQIWGDANTTGQRVEPGTPLLLQGGWKLARGAAGNLPRFGGIAVTGAEPGEALSAAYAGVVTLTHAQWDAAIDPADRAAAPGLQAGADYWLSSTLDGKLTRDRSSGVLVGQALTSSSLFIFPKSDWTTGGGSTGRWFLQSLDDCLSTALQDGDVLGWNQFAIDRARFINGERTQLIIRHDSRVVDPGTGAVIPDTDPHVTALAPTDNHLISGQSILQDGELFLGTNPRDPAVFFKLADGSTAKLAPAAAAHTSPAVDLQAVDYAQDPDAAQVQLVDGAGAAHEVVLRGAHGIEVTCSNRGTLVISGEALWKARLPGIDGGRFSPKPAYSPPVGMHPGWLDAGRFTRPEVLPPDADGEVDAGDFKTGKP